MSSFVSSQLFLVKSILETIHTMIHVKQIQQNEKMQLVLYHPDIHPGYEPPTPNTQGMRKLFLHLVKKPLSQQDSKISSEAIDTKPAARGKIKDNAAISTAMTNDHASVDVVAATNPENAVVQDNSWIVTNIAEV